MGCNPSRVNSTSSIVTAEQNHRLVKEIWTLICNEYYEEVGMRFMIRLFQTYPELRRLWIFAANLENEDEIRSNAQTRYHAAKIMYILNQLVNDIDDYDKRRHTLEGLGKNHFVYDVKPSDFQAAKLVMEDVLSTILGPKLSLRHKQAWAFFFQQIIVDLGRGVEKQIALGTEINRVSLGTHETTM